MTMRHCQNRGRREVAGKRERVRRRGEQGGREHALRAAKVSSVTATWNQFRCERRSVHADHVFPAVALFLVLVDPGRFHARHGKTTRQLKTKTPRQ